MKTQNTRYFSVAIAKEWQTFIGGFKKWESAKFDTRQEAKDCLSAFIEGQKHRVSYTVIREVKGAK